MIRPFFLGLVAPARVIAVFICHSQTELNVSAQAACSPISILGVLRVLRFLQTHRPSWDWTKNVSECSSQARSCLAVPRVPRDLSSNSAFGRHIRLDPHRRSVNNESCVRELLPLPT